MSDIIVCKVGGALMKDAAAINRFVQEVRSEPRRRIIVPSAPGSRGGNDQKITDLLIDYTRSMPRRRECLGTEVRQRFCSIMRQVIPTLELGRAFTKDMEVWPSLPMDAVVSRGEHWIARILAKLRGFEFVDATKIVRFDENGRLDMERTRHNTHLINEALDRSSGIVMPGFYGMMPDGMTIKTFPRNASDLSGAIVADLVEASRYEIWKETSVRVASPKIVKAARSVRYLSYEEGVALTDRGSEVVYSPAVELMREAGIPIHVIGINDPPGEITVMDSVENIPRAEAGSISGIASRGHMSILTVRRRGMHEEVGVLGTIFRTLTELGVRVHHPLDGIDTVDAIVETEAIKELLPKLDSMLKKRLNGVEILYKPERALITVVGRGLDGFISHARILQALSKAGIKRGEFSQGSEPHVFTVLVYMEHHKQAIQAICREFA